MTGLDLGADGYLVKSFAFEELMARVGCVSRRPHALANVAKATLRRFVYIAQCAVAKT